MIGQNLDKFTAFWMDASTAPGTPLASLSPTITIREIAPPYTVVVNADAMTNMGGGHYIYQFSAMSVDKEYVYYCNPGATALIESGITNNELYKTIIENRGGGGGYSVNLSGVTNSISNLGKLVREEHDKTRQHVTKENNETNSHIDVVKGEINDKIEAIEIPEVPETDLSTITQGIGALKVRFTKLSTWLKTEQKKEMEAKDKENEGKVTELQTKIDELEKVFEEMQNLSKSEIADKQKLIDEMEETAQELITSLEQEKNINKDEVEKEIKGKLISSLSE